MVGDEYYTHVTDDELDELIQTLRQDELPPSCGIGTIQGHLQSEGIFLANARRRIWKRLVRIDPVETSLR